MSGVRPVVRACASAFRYAPRCVTTTPFGRPVVPLVALMPIGRSSSSGHAGSAAPSPLASSASYGAPVGIASASTAAAAGSASAREGRIVDDDPRARLLDDGRHLGRREPRVDRAQHAAGQRDPVVRLERHVAVRRQHRHALARREAARDERAPEGVAAVVELRPRPRAVAVDDRRAIAVREGAAAQEEERGQLLAVRALGHAGMLPRPARRAARAAHACYSNSRR